MQILLQIKQDYLTRTGITLPVHTTPLHPVLTRVSGIEAQPAPAQEARARVDGSINRVPRMLPKRPIDRVLMMHRSFRVGWGPNGT